MKTINNMATFLLMTFFLFGCSNIENSRNVNDSKMPGKTIAIQVCSACHGVTGESISPLYPKLAGQQKDYIVAQLEDFKGHRRKDKAGVERMWGFTHLTKEQIQQIADYFSSQKPMHAKEKPDSELLSRGKLIFTQGITEAGVTQCNACHGPNGEGNSVIPRLAGQHADYVVHQLNVFQKTDERPRGAPMKQVTHNITEADIQAVAQYVETLGSKDSK